MAYTTIDDPAVYFNTKLYTGTGSSNAVTGVGFQPDLTWIKNRGDAESHVLFDSVRTNGYYLKSDATSAEIDGSSGGSGLWSAFTSDGFTVLNGNRTNDSSNTYASWNWKAGTTGSGTTTGAGTGKAYSYSVNTTAGFSIVKYIGNGDTGQTIPHHLGVIPGLIIVKGLAASRSWMVWSSGGTSTKNTSLNSTEIEHDSGASGWSQGIIGVPTSSNITFTAGATNNNSICINDENYIAYCFAEKQGYSKFGSYVASGHASDANFIYLGFKPAWVMFKKTSGADNWLILDNKRSSSSGKNLVDFHLRANLTNAESDLSGSDNGVDFLSNGIKLRKNNGEFNSSGGTYIYMAFAEAPFVSSTGVPACAR
tara:strand:- start:4 stop:1104 length:1101 start_codon:yes stop_codon:yes gene_type:complete